jgi:TatD DNase family protein
LSSLTNNFEIADSHAHLDMEEFSQDREDVLRRAWEGGVRALLCPAEMTTAESLRIVLGLSERYPWIAAAAGVHPHQAKESSLGHLERIKTLATQGKIRAVGEIGLDYHYDFSTPESQRLAFRQQLELAQELALPVIVHSRNAGREISAAVEEAAFTRGGVLHCFSEDWQTAGGMMERGFFISFSGILTFPNARKLREIARKTPLDKILLETDSPYLVPHPLRRTTKRNEPLFIIETARVLAGLKKLPLEEIGRIAGENFQRLFIV